jgi:hypothetical protein
MQDPQTQAEWQEAVNLADLWLTFEAARNYGLIKGGPEIDVERCVAILCRGEDQGILPQPDQLDELIRELFLKS